MLITLPGRVDSRNPQLKDHGRRASRMEQPAPPSADRNEPARISSLGGLAKKPPSEPGGSDAVCAVS
jgi:hypothetical protein